MLKKQVFPCLSIILTVIFLATNPSWATPKPMINTYWNDFSEGMGHEMSFHDPSGLYALDDQNGTLHISKNSDDLYDFFRAAKISTQIPISGDFDIRIDFQLMEPLQNGDQLELQIYGETFYFFAVRSNESGLGGQNVHVFYGENEGSIAPTPCIAFTAMEGTLRVKREGETLTAFAKSHSMDDFQIIFSYAFPVSDVHFKLSIQSQPFSHGAQDVHLDNFRIMLPNLCVLENGTRPVSISDGAQPYSIVNFDSTVINITPDNEMLYISGSQAGASRLTISAADQQLNHIFVRVIPQGNLSGSLRDENNQPVPNVSIEIESLHRYASISTQNDGFFEFNGLYPGPLEITMRPQVSSGLLPVFKSFMLKEGEHLSLNGITLKKGTCVSGTLKKPDNTALSSAMLFIPGLGKTSAMQPSENGHFMLCLPRGEWFLNLSSNDDYGLYPVSITVQDQDTIQLGEIFTYAYSQENRISGRVFGSNITPWDYLQVVAFPAELDIHQGNIAHVSPFAFGDVNIDNNYELFTPSGQAVQLFLVSSLDEPFAGSSVTILDHHASVTSPKSNESFDFNVSGYTIQSQVLFQNQPVPNCQAVLISVQTRHMVAFADTDNNGRLTFYHVPPSDYEISVENDSYSGTTPMFNVYNDGYVPDVYLSSIVPEMEYISGTIFGADNMGIPYLSGQVFADNCWNNFVANFQSEENGQYRVQVPPGNYFLMLHANPQSNPKSIQQWWAVNGGVADCMEASPVIVQPESSAQDINFTLIPGVLVTGAVTSANDTPLTTICIQARHDACKGQSVAGTQSFDHGRYEMVLLPGEYALQASGCNDHNMAYMDQFWNHAESCAQATILQIPEGHQTIENIDFKLTIGYLLHGRVVDSSHTPIAHLTVGIWHERAAQWRETDTDDQGHFTLMGIPEGSAFIEIKPDIANRRAGYREREIISGPREIQLSDIVLQDGFLVTGKLLRPDSTPVIDAELECFAEDHYIDLKTNDIGEFSQLLSPGIWTIMLDEDDRDVSLIPFTFTVQDSDINLGDRFVYLHSPDNRISGTVQVPFTPVGNLEVILFPATVDFSPEQFHLVHPFNFSEPDDLGQFQVHVPNDIESMLVLISMIDEDSGEVETGTVFQMINGIHSPQSNVSFQWQEEGHLLSGCLLPYNDVIKGNETVLLYRMENESTLFAGFSEMPADGCFRLFNVPSGTYQVVVNVPDAQFFEQTEWFDLTSSHILPPIIVYGKEIVSGDINGNGMLDLSDVLIGLRVAADLPVNQTLFLRTDINTDGIIGMQESVYVLRNIAQ
ncbi:MAG: carboxypeptidase regulatory-like domain-containing protein [Candidatus Magnetomorum sp.]|nr:carboxypeptidase regulatory-like domain-containing protein [Candidatus Magnetomorum sp.]